MLETTYWAAEDRLKIGVKLVERIKGYGTAKLTTGIYQRNAREFQYYYGLDPSGIHATSQVLRKGEQGELAAIRVNHSRALVNTLLNLIVSSKVVWQPKAVNIDYDSIRECELAASILEYYWTDKEVLRMCVKALEEALVFGEGFVMMLWDPEAGDAYAALPAEPPVQPLGSPSGGPDTSLPPQNQIDPEPGPSGPGVEPPPTAGFAPQDDLFNNAQVVSGGDVVLSNVSSWDVLRDSNKYSWEDCEWVIIRSRQNKWDVIARSVPELRDDILHTPNEIDHTFKHPGVKETTEDIAVYYFFHKKTPSMPQGRQVVFLANETVLSDGALEYEEIPLYRVAAAEMTGTPFGYTPFLDILGMQEVLDSLHTSVTTNLTTFGTQNVAMEQGSEIMVDDLAGGMRAFYYPQGGKKPEALSLAQVPREIFAYLDSLKTQQELVLGLNSVVRGEPQSGELSGAALALLQSQALQQSSVAQSNYLRFVRQLGDALIRLFKERANAPLKVAIAGKGSGSLVADTEFTGQDLARIHSVQVEIGNPLSQTAAGRLTMAESMMKLGVIQSPEQYMEVLASGQLKPITESAQQELQLIRSENEDLSNGVNPPTLALDDHSLHAREHRGVLANPQARRNPAVANAVLEHIKQHEALMYTTPPELLALVGVAPPAMPLSAPLGPPGAPPGPGGPPGAGPGGPSGPPPPPPGNPGEGKMPNMPHNPQNPATGRTWDPKTGGGMVQPPQ